MSIRLPKVAVAGITAAVLGVGLVVGVVNARPSEQSPTPSATPRPGQQQAQQRMDEFINRLAQNLGVTPDKLRDALKQTGIQEVDAAQAAGRLTPEQAQRLKDAINSGTFPRFGLGFGPGHMGGRMERAGQVGQEKIAGFLGITQDQLKQELRGGKSLAEVATAHGKTADQLKQFITDTAQEQLAQAVKDGKMTQQQADRALDALKGHIDDMINHKPGAGMGGPRRGR